MRFFLRRFAKVVLVGLPFFIVIAWMTAPHLPEGVSRREARFNDREVSFLVVDLSQRQWEWRLVNDPDAPKSVSDWRTELGAAAVWNAAYFSEDHMPSGYLKAGGEGSVVPWPSTDEQKEEASYSFLVDLTGDGMSLAYLPDNSRSEPQGDAFLSFPTLVADGEPIVEENSFRAAKRTALAEDATGRDYLIVTERGMVTLFGMAQWLAQQPENFMTAGNLDGGPSTGVSIDSGLFGIEVPSDKVPSVIAVFTVE